MQAEHAPPVAPSDGESEATLQPHAAGVVPTLGAPDAPAGLDGGPHAHEMAAGLGGGVSLEDVHAAHANSMLDMGAGNAPLMPIIDPSGVGMHMGMHYHHNGLHFDGHSPEKTSSDDKSSIRKRVPTAVAAAAGEQAQAEANARSKPKRKKVVDDGSVSRTTHGGVKIGGRAVTWVGGAGMSREALDKMGIPQLRAVFLKTFMHPTGSNNAEWLRKKLAQVPDPTVGAARAAVPRARDVTAEIWTTGTQFKGFTKQERQRLQQMGGNCEAKVVEVVGNEVEMNLYSDMHSMPSKGKKKSGRMAPEMQTMQIIGQEKFEMPPPKRLRGNSHHHDMSPASMKAMASYEMDAARAANPMMMGGVYDPNDGTLQNPGQQVEPALVASHWRDLEYDERLLLQAGMNVKVYRADENWHHGSLQKVEFQGSDEDLRMCVTIYYWEHDQSETRDISEFFRGEANSLIQWQAPTAIEGAAFPQSQNQQCRS